MLKLQYNFFCFKVHKGVKGVVKDESGQPIKDAKISIRNREKDVKTAVDGDYWRLLLPGDYEVTASARGYVSSTKKAKVEDAPATQVNFVLKKVNPQHRERQYDQMTHAGEKPGTGVIPGPLFGAGFPGGNMRPSGGGLATSGLPINQDKGNMGMGDYGNLATAGAGDGAVPAQPLQDGPIGMSDEMSNPIGHLENALDSYPNVGILPNSRVEDGLISNYQTTLPKLNSITGIDAMNSNAIERFRTTSNQASPAVQGRNLDSIAMSSPFESNARDYLDGQYSARNTQLRIR